MNTLDIQIMDVIQPRYQRILSSIKNYTLKSPAFRNSKVYAALQVNLLKKMHLLIIIIINVYRNENAIWKGQLYRTEAVLDVSQLSNDIWLCGNIVYFN